MKKLCLLLAMGMIAGCAYSQEEFDRLARSAAPCRTTDTCERIEATPCTCAYAVNVRHAESLRKRAPRLDCEGKTVQCEPVVGTPKCVDDRCVFAP